MISTSTHYQDRGCILHFLLLLLFSVFLLSFWKRMGVRWRRALKKKEIEQVDCGPLTWKVFFLILSDLNQAVPNHRRESNALALYATRPSQEWPGQTLICEVIRYHLVRYCWWSTFFIEFSMTSWWDGYWSLHWKIRWCWCCTEIYTLSLSGLCRPHLTQRCRISDVSLI